MNRRALVGIIVTGLIVISIFYNNSNFIPSNGRNQTQKNFIGSQSSFLPIEIINDDNFTDYGFEGFGNETHPYIIEGYSIITPETYGIYIDNTTKHFVIRYCYIDAHDYGIYIYDAAVGTASVINNTCSNNDCGIRLMHSPESFVTNNTCTNNEFGIKIDNSSGSNLTFNNCNNNGFHGIYLQNCYSAILINNTCRLNNICGLLLYASFGALITNNTCGNNNLNGIYLDASSNAQIIRNNFESNHRYGIELSISDYCLISYNAILESNVHGLYLESGSDFNIIHHNTFYRNNLDGTSQASDNGINNVFYDVGTNEGNYWSDWHFGSYFIDGSAHSEDPYPLGQPIIPVSEFSQRNIIIIILVPCLALVLILLGIKRKFN